MPDQNTCPHPRLSGTGRCTRCLKLLEGAEQLIPCPWCEVGRISHQDLICPSCEKGIRDEQLNTTTLQQLLAIPEMAKAYETQIQPTIAAFVNQRRFGVSLTADHIVRVLLEIKKCYDLGEIRVWDRASGRVLTILGIGFQSADKNGSTLADIKDLKEDGVCDQRKKRFQKLQRRSPLFETT